MQGTVKSYDPSSKQGAVLDDSGREVPLAPDALDGSIFRTLREGQRVVYELVNVGGTEAAGKLRLGQDDR